MYQIVGETELQLDCEALTLWCLNLEAQKALEGINSPSTVSPFFLISSWDGDLEFFFFVLLGWDYRKTKFGNHFYLFERSLFVFYYHFV